MILVTITIKRIFVSSFKFQPLWKILIQLPWKTFSIILILNCLLLSLESRITGYLGSIANAAKEKIQVYAVKFANMIFHNDKFQVENIDKKGLTPSFLPSSSKGEKFIHITDEISIYGIDKLLKKGKKKTVMTLQETAKQMREMKPKGMGGSTNWWHG